MEALALEESEAGLHNPAIYNSFAGRSERLRDLLQVAIDDIWASGMRLAGYGAPAKASTLLNYCDIGQDKLEFTVDANPYKQGRLVPGVRVPIYAPSMLSTRTPGAVFVLAWNLREEISGLLGGGAGGPRLLFHQPSVELV